MRGWSLNLTGTGFIQQLNQNLMGSVHVKILSFVGRNDKYQLNSLGILLGTTGIYCSRKPMWLEMAKQTSTYLDRFNRGQPDFTAKGQLDFTCLRHDWRERDNQMGLLSFSVPIKRGISGLASIKNGFLWGDWFPHPIESLNGSLEVTPEAIRLTELDSIVGGGAVELTGDVNLSGLEATDYDLSMSLVDGRIQLLDWLPPVLGSGDFRIIGPVSYPMLSGDVNVSAMNFTDRIDWEGALISFAPEALVGASTDEEGYFQYDINMVADNSIRIRNNLADVYASADLKFIGDLATPGMMGTVTLAEQGRALFKERDFSIQKGLLRYEDPYSFDQYWTSH